MPKYLKKQIFTHGRWSKAKDGENERKRKRERLNDGNNNGQLRIATPLRVAHAKPPGPITSQWLICLQQFILHLLMMRHGVKLPVASTGLSLLLNQILGLK